MTKYRLIKLIHQITDELNQKTKEELIELAVLNGKHPFTKIIMKTFMEKR